MLAGAQSAHVALARTHASVRKARARAARRHRPAHAFRLSPAQTRAMRARGVAGGRQWWVVKGGGGGRYARAARGSARAGGRQSSARSVVRVQCKVVRCSCRHARMRASAAAQRSALRSAQCHESKMKAPCGHATVE